MKVPFESDRAFFERLDAALYRAKGKGRNRVVTAGSLRLAVLQ